MNNYIIYCHTNKINGKKYIGQTCQSPQKRWGNNGSEYIKKGNIHFKNAILKYGWDNFTHEILYTNLSPQEADEKEIELIKQYDTTNSEYGYNIAAGGNSNTLTLEQKQQITKRNQLYWENGIFKKAINKIVYCVELDCEFESALEASRQTLIDNSSIIKACNHKHNYAGLSPKGQPLHWLYIEEVNEQTIQKLKNRTEILKGAKIPVFCPETQEYFNSSDEAAKKYNITIGAIRGVIRGDRKTAGEYNNTPLHWVERPDLIKNNSKITVERWEELLNV